MHTRCNIVRPLQSLSSISTPLAISSSAVAVHPCSNAMYSSSKDLGLTPEKRQDKLQDGYRPLNPLPITSSQPALPWPASSHPLPWIATC
eukprot:m.48011 g.48011  ORF g.48011 m.48011 type:complete len:90 (-) comp13259_c0_seq4:115-384(-)